MQAEPIDLHHLGDEHVIGCYLLETEKGLALQDCGPATCAGELLRALGERGVQLTDLRHLLLSHIHLDHAGAAGTLVREHPGLTVHVSARGAPHLADPARLEASARRLYGDAFDTLWGELVPVPQASIRTVGERVLGLECFPSPGHASHHVCYLDGDGTLYAGDAAGVRVQPSPLVWPPTPPPEVDVAAWSGTLDELERRAPERIALVHFGVVSDPVPHLAGLRARLDAWAQLVGEGASEAEFVAAARDELERTSPLLVEVYDRAMPLWQSYAGLRRWAEKRAA